VKLFKHEKTGKVGIFVKQDQDAGMIQLRFKHVLIWVKPENYERISAVPMLWDPNQTQNPVSEKTIQKSGRRVIRAVGRRGK